MPIKILIYDEEKEDKYTETSLVGLLEEYRKRDVGEDLIDYLISNFDNDDLYEFITDLAAEVEEDSAFVLERIIMELQELYKIKLIYNAQKDEI